MKENEQLMDEHWRKLLAVEFEKPYFIALKHFLEEDRMSFTVYPPSTEIYNAFHFTALNDVKVVIIGQDPYHGPGQAHGLSFSVPFGIKPPPSLKNIFKELKSDLGIEIPKHGNLESWAKQGVMLLNTTLTVRAGDPLSHQNKGWEIFTNAVIQLLSRERTGLVFLLWGQHAHNKVSLINEQKHYILKAAHPSPFSAYRGFFGCRHFSRTNAILISNLQTEIDWNLE